MVPLSWYLALGAALFIIGTAGVLLRRNVLIVLLSLELMLNSAKITQRIGEGHQVDVHGVEHQFQ